MTARSGTRIAVIAVAVAALRVTAVPAQSTRIVGADTSTWIGASGQWRLRGEGWAGFAAGAPAGATHDDGFALSRFKLKGELHVRGAFALVAEAKSSLATDRSLPGGTRASDEDVIDMQQLFGELRGTAAGTTGSLRAG